MVLFLPVPFAFAGPEVAETAMLPLVPVLAAKIELRTAVAPASVGVSPMPSSNRTNACRFLRFNPRVVGADYEKTGRRRIFAALADDQAWMRNSPSENRF